MRKIGEWGQLFKLEKRRKTLCFQDEGVDINLLDGDDATPLHFAASRGHSDTVNKYISPRYLFYQHGCCWFMPLPRNMRIPIAG